MIMKQFQVPVKLEPSGVIPSSGAQALKPADLRVVGPGGKNSANGVFRENSERNHFYLYLFDHQAHVC